MALPRDPGGRPRPARRPSLQRHASFPVPKPEIQRSAPPPRRAPRPTGVFRGPALAPPTRNLTRPTPTKRIERKLPPAVAPSYPVLRHYTPAQQRTIVRGIQRAGARSPDRGAIRPSTLAPLGAVRRQQEAAANRRYARGFDVTPQQAAVLRTVSNLRSQAQAKIPHPPSLGTRLLHALLTGGTGQPSQQTAVSGLTRNLATAGLQPATGTFNPLGATYEKAPHIPLSGPLGLGTLSQSLSYDAARNQRTADVFGRELQRSLRSSAKGQRSGSGGSAIAPAFLRAPLAQFLTAAADAAPVASRIGAGAANDLGQYILGAVPSTAMLGQQAIKDPRGALRTLAGSTADILKHPLDHPLFALQLAHGGVNVASRGAGALGRSGIAGAKVRGALNTRRAPLQIGGPGATKLLEYRHYSKSPLVMAAQKAADRRLKAGTMVVDQHGRAVRAKLAPQSELGGIRRSISALHTSTLGQDARGRLRGYGDFAADRANSVERHNRAAIQRELVKMMPTRAHRGGRAGQAVGAYLDRVLHAQPHGPFSLPRRMYRPERDVIGLVIRGRVRNAGTFRADLEAELARLKTRAGKSFAHPEERALNEQNQRSIERVLGDPRALRAENVKRLVDAGRALAGRGRELTKQAVRQGALTPEAAARAPLFDYAIAHMGARYVTREEHARLEREGLRRERAAAQRVRDVQQAARPLVYQHEIKTFVKQSVVKEPVYSVRSAETARAVQSFGLDPGRSRKGVFGAGAYLAVGKADRSYRGTAVEAHVNIRKPFVVANDTAMAQMRPYREAAMERVGRSDNEAIAQEMTRLLKADGYDSVIVKGAGHDGQDWVNVFDPQRVRVTAPKTTVRTGEIDRTTAAQIAKDAGVRLVAHRSEAGSTALEIHGPRDRARIAAHEIADRTDSPARVFHEADGGSAVAYFHNGELIAIDPTLSHDIASRLRSRYGGTLTARYGDAADIAPGQTAGVRGALEAARGEHPVRTAAGEPRTSITHAEALAAAKAEHRAARATRIAVSGRHPELVDQHEAAVARAAVAKRKMKQAQAAHAREVGKRQRTIGTQQSRRGRRQAEELGTSLKVTRGERPTGRATAAEQARLAAHDTAIRDAAAARRAAEKAHRDARAAVPARPPINPALRDAEGKLLTNEQIHAHMRANGVPFDREGPLISYVPDRPDVNSRASYHRAQALLKRDTVESGFQRTGAAQQKGITGQSFNLVADHMVRMGITTGDGAIGQFDKLAREVGTLDKDGRPFDSRSAADALANLNAHPDQPKLVAVRLFPGRYSPGQRDLIQRIQGAQALDPSHYGSDLETYVERSFADRVLGDDALSSGDRTRNIALMPEELVSRFQQHLSALSTRSPTGALLAKGFRTAVLPFSVKWLTGNVAEAIIRLAVIGANPFDYAAGRRVLNQARGRPQRNLMGRKVLSEIIGLDAQHAGLSTEVGSSLLGGLLYGEPGLTVHRGVSDYEHSNMRVPAQVIGGLAHTTMLGEIGHELMRIPRTIFHLNRILEQQSQLVALGRYARRDIQEFTGSYAQTLRLQHKAVREAARGLYNTATQRDAARFIDETLGKYSRFSPRLRALIQTATPFLPWYLNAARFVFWTMPMKHPTTTAVLVAAEHAFSKDLADQHKDLPPGELKSAVKSGGGWLDLARFTPFGAFTGIVGGDLKQVASPFLPQAQGIYHALSGEDPFGRQLQVPKTPDNPKGIATQGDIRRTVLDQAIGSFVPGYSPIERIAQHGETPYSGRNSLLFGIHTKPGSSHGSSGLERFANPFRPVFLKPRKQAAGVDKGNGWGAGGSSTRSSTTPSTGWGSGGGGSSSGWGG